MPLGLMAMLMISLPTIVRWLIPVCLVVVSIPAGALAGRGDLPMQTGTAPRCLVYRGAWFEVRYPVGFTVRPSLASSTAEGYDSAEFNSPDGSVSFYVYSPQWGGEPADIALDPERESLLSEQLYREREPSIRLFTIRAKDGSYFRSYRETLAHQGSVRTVVGIKYRSKEARLRYQKNYEQFRRSLKQFAD